MSASKKTKEQMQADGYYFTEAQIDRIVDEATKIGFVPLPYLAKTKKFDKTEIEGSLSLRHVKTDNLITIEPWKLKNFGIDIFKDNMADVLFTLLFREIEDKDYVANYHP